jgi:CRISPR-associated endonuclease/helicase Cas3
MNHLVLWAKSDPYHSLWCHLLDVAAVCEGLLPHFGGVSPLPDTWVVLLAALHDIGKADPWFQNKDSGLADRLRAHGLQLPDTVAPADDGKRKFRHEVRSADWIRDWLKIRHGWDKRAARVASEAVRGHHGDFSPEHYYKETLDQQRTWVPLRTALGELIWDALQPPLCTIDRFDNASAAGAKLSGLIVLADWIASNDELYPYQKLDETVTPADYLSAARGEAAAILRRLQLDTPPASQVDGAPTFQEVWPEFGDLPRPIQRKLEELCRAGLPPGLAIIEAPMGEGKTEAAVYLAECWNLQAGRRGCYLALPTQATANQMHGRYERFLKNRRPAYAGSRLVHGMAWLIDSAAPAFAPQMFGGDDDRKAELLAREWFRPARRALLAAEGVGTVDQALMAALRVKFGFLRLLGLGAKTLIIDEVHAYDDYMSAIMECLMKWCRALKISVILLSATLSREQKEKLCAAYAGSSRLEDVDAFFDQGRASETPYPLLTFLPIDGPPRAVPVAADATRSRPVAVQPHPGLLDDAAGTARLAASLVHSGGCACVLTNTVRSAQEVFASLQKMRQSGELPETELLLFHARFRAERRNDIERKCVTDLFGKDAGEKRPRRAILVATQVVEQSLDVDFDVMLSQLAPIDLLLQRSGRMWRHKRDWRGGATRPVLHVLVPTEGCLKFGATEKIYTRETLLRTLSLLHGRAAFNLPADFRPLIEGCYSRESLPNNLIAPDELAAAARTHDEERDHNANLAQRHLLPEPKPDVFEMAAKSAEESEGEGGTQSYFVAQTRLGDESRAALVLDDPTLFALAKTDLDEARKPRRERKAPPRGQLKKLFLQKVNLPTWWLAKVQPCHGYEPYFDGRAWLRGHVVLLLREGQWRGQDATGREFVIRDHPMLGLQRTVVSPEGDVTKGEVDEEADAGQTA